ncbi:calcium/calmodulin-dependent protein kinase type IV-like [Nannospalax galili]|uniref:calcium/calmodulin-dependent protein kinase type IV-like n=1 Tax=Nannospalax galili TaxID=1026970 RepID=UPI0004ED3B3A|nr:calcium/calmodulin-dependent protein kinase type IV-like [Nannospalax galili]
MICFDSSLLELSQTVSIGLYYLAAVKAVVASSRLGSASSSHSSIQESHKESREPSPTQDVKDNKALSEKKMQEGAKVAAKGAGAELRKLDLGEMVKDAVVNAEEASRMVPQALEDRMKTAGPAEPAIERGLGEEKMKTMEEAVVPKDEEETLAVGLGTPQEDVILPEY